MLSALRCETSEVERSPRMSKSLEHSKYRDSDDLKGLDRAFGRSGCLGPVHLAAYRGSIQELVLSVVYEFMCCKEFIR